MSFDWENYITLAEDLKTKRNISIKEAYHRCIISKAYYGIFKIIYEFLQTEGFNPKRNVHRSTIDQLEQAPDPIRKTIASNLRTLKIKRVKADYDSGITMNLQDAEFQIILAKEVLKQFKELKDSEIT